MGMQPAIAIRKRNCTYDRRKFEREFATYTIPADDGRLIVNRLYHVVTEITLLTNVGVLKFNYQLTLKRFVYLFLHLRHFKRHPKHQVGYVLY